METPQYGYKVKEYGHPVKRYCQTLDLKNDPELISEYVRRHSKKEFWPEIAEGMKDVGILEMEIYLLDNRLFMIVETSLDFEWEEAFKRLATLPRQAEWEKHMSLFQIATPGASSSEKWKLMNKIFNIYT